jgi:hypothetical protein
VIALWFGLLSVCLFNHFTQQTGGSFISRWRKNEQRPPTETHLNPYKGKAGNNQNAETDHQTACPHRAAALQFSPHTFMSSSKRYINFNINMLTSEDIIT